MNSPRQNTTTRFNEQAAGERPARKLALRWLSPGAQRSVQWLEGAKLLIGRAADADIVLDASGVSRRHAELHRQGPIYAIRDLGSTNGTHVNGSACAHSGLSEGDVIRLGSMVGVVARLDPTRGQRDSAEPAPGSVFGPDLASSLDELTRVADSDLPVMIWGETGVGKECVARALHTLSGRSGAFHAVNCAALPPALAEAELFGHRRGAFTGAEQAAQGHLRAAQGGTLLLDELADLPMPVQAKLLRALQERVVTPLGETRGVPIDVRFVAACQSLPSELVADGRLRQDLHARLNGLTLEVPPLRQRRADIAVLFGYFLTRQCGGRPPLVDAELLESLLLYAWPSNVRELELLTRRLLVLHGAQPLLRRAHLPEEVRAPRSASASTDSGLLGRREHDLRAFAAALRQTKGNVTQAAASVGISRQRAYRLLGKQSVEAVMGGAAAAAAADESDESRQH
jgi:transcriptional regulator of acetoin/glycerol metabolism